MPALRPAGQSSQLRLGSGLGWGWPEAGTPYTDTRNRFFCIAGGVSAWRVSPNTNTAFLFLPLVLIFLTASSLSPPSHTLSTGCTTSSWEEKAQIKPGSHVLWAALSRCRSPCGSLETPVSVGQQPWEAFWALSPPKLTSSERPSDFPSYPRGHERPGWEFRAPNN